MEYVKVDERALPVGAAEEDAVILALNAAPAPAPAPAPTQHLHDHQARILKNKR